VTWRPVPRIGGFAVSDFAAIIGGTRAIGGAATPRHFREVFCVAGTPSRIELGSPRGQTMAEYAVILTVITIAIVAAIAFLGTSLGTHITNAANLVLG
jgi:Flp pilus assembly pilin Flp